MKKMRVLAVLALLVAVVAGATPIMRVWDHGDGTVRVQRKEIFNTPLPLQTNLGEIARLPYGYVLPATNPIYFAWDGTNVVVASAAVQSNVNAAIAAQKQAQEDQHSPEKHWENILPVDKTQFKLQWMMLTNDYPSLTFSNYLKNIVQPVYQSMFK